MSTDFSVIIPTYNEAQNIEPLLNNIINLLDKNNINYEIIVSDDNSPDGTADIVNSLSKQNPRIKLLNRKGKKKGLSISVIDAFNIAEGKILAVIDGDGQHDENCLLTLYYCTQANDMTVGSRFLKASSIEEHWPLYRLFASKIAIFVINLLLNIKLSDPMSGCFAISRESYKAVKPFLKGEGFKIMLETSYILKKINPNAKIAEIPIHFKKRNLGKSKLGFNVTLDLIKMVLRLKFSSSKFNAKNTEKL